MARKRAPAKGTATAAGRPSALLDTRIIYCGDCLDQVQKLPDGCVDLIYIDPPFNSNRNYEVFWGETKEKRGRVAHPLMGGGVDDDGRRDWGYVIVHALSLAPL